jgi:hypothetical protein
MSELRWKGNIFEQRESDNYVCLTQMAKIFDKEVYGWTRTEAGKSYIKAVSEETQICGSQLLVSLKGNSENFEQGTWAHPLIAIAFAQWLSPEFHVWCNLHIKLLIETQGKQHTKQIPEVTEKTVEVFMHGIEFLTNSGDLQLAQLLKNQFGNTLLASQQNSISGDIADNYEGVVDVAIRLGFRISKNHEASLGKYVKKHCMEFVRGKNNRYSNASAKQVPATMYPAFCAAVEKAVTEYCVMKGISNSQITLLD